MRKKMFDIDCELCGDNGAYSDTEMCGECELRETRDILRDKVSRLSARVKVLEEALDEARALIEKAYRYPLSETNGACGIGCDMGEAGPGPNGEHDPGCNIAELYKLLSTRAGEGGA